MKAEKSRRGDELQSLKRKENKIIKQLIYKETGGFLPLQKDSLKKTLILDMDETLIHTDFSPSFNYENILEVVLDGDKTTVFLSLRPGVSEFIEHMYRFYELVLFTASVSSYASPILNIIDPQRRISHRLFRQHSKAVNGTYIKDLSRIGRTLKDVILVDNLPISYILQQENGIPIKSW